MTEAEIERRHDLVVVIDFGAQYAQLIARRVREARVYSEVLPHTASVAEIVAKQPKAIILSGGPQSVYAPGAPQVDPGLFQAGLPAFGICYGFQAMARALGGDVARTGLSEFGRTQARVDATGTLLADLPPSLQVWMSHGDSVAASPAGFTDLASTAGAPVAAFENVAAGLAGVQWHPEVLHSQAGQQVLERFLYDIAGCTPDWTPANIVDDSVAADPGRRSGDGKVICALSGGVDSAVAAALVQRAIGDQLTCVFVDHGLLRKGEAEQVEQDFVAATGVELRVVDASAQFLGELAGVTDPEAKRKIIGREFIRCFERAAREIVGRDRSGRLPGAGHALPGCRGVGRRRGRGQHQEPPQRRRAARRPAVRADRAAADPVQGRGTRRRGAAGAAGGDGLAAAVPRARAGDPDHR